MGCTVFKTYKKGTFKTSKGTKEDDSYEKSIKNHAADLATSADREIVDYLKVIRAPIMILESNPLYMKRKFLLP